jgi:transposase
MFKNKKYARTIIRIPDDLWNESKNILPDEKPDNTIGRPIVPFRKVFDGILFILRTGSRWKMLPREYMVLVQHVIEDFRNGCNQVFLIDYR